MPKLRFRPIDAKESCSYEPIEIGYDRANNMHNAKIMVHANAEYLNALLDLQKCIKDKFEPQLIENIKAKNEPEYIENVDGFANLEKEYKTLIKPGADNLYYT